MSIPIISIFRHTYNTKVDRNIIGDVHLDDLGFFCYSLEDEKRADGVKVHGKTAIAPGTYDFEVTYSPRFKRQMILIKGVPDFSGVRIHGGNTSKDSHGCPLVAFNTDYIKIWGTAEKKITKWAQDRGGKGKVVIKDAFLSYDKEKHDYKINT